jgi:hypothetical protein
MKDLRIGLAGMTLLTISKVLEPLVRSIAGKSRLERLDIKTSASRVWRSGVHATEFFSYILANYSQTLQILKLPHLHPSVELMQRILSECKVLRKLWIGATSSLVVSLFNRN